ncbi:MAG: type II toxin-antitoxin system RelE/ParE family toxin [Synergistaceae bacterium]|jgi:mRNA interferase RelE/StbE|nr:type II toxin-antitoxin system RelE/ParE family toxin [Synergistaceae bacterium]
MAHSIKYLPSAREALDALPADIHKRAIKSIGRLKNNPRPSGCNKLTGKDAYRIRVGDYRVVYEIHDDKLIVVVIRVAHRGKVYKD